MPYYLEKEYHPVIEDYINQYTEGNLDGIESDSFEELLFQDDDLRELTFAAVGGKYLLEQFRTSNNVDDLASRLLNDINHSGNK